LRQSGQKKTRPSAEYDANGLASPDIEIGSRRPVNEHCLGPAAENVIQFTFGKKVPIAPKESFADARLAR
jgi:hypothetical protein